MIARRIDGAVIPRNAAHRWRATSLLAALVLALGTAGCTVGCQDALASGVLEAQGDELVLRTESGEIMRVAWPDWYGPAEADGQLVLTHPLHGIVARQGDTVNMGGGTTPGETVFQGCGDVWVSEAGLR